MNFGPPAGPHGREGGGRTFSRCRIRQAMFQTLYRTRRLARLDRSPRVGRLGKTGKASLCITTRYEAAEIAGKDGK